MVPGTKLFLYNYRERELSGIFEATSHGDLSIVPDAFLRWGSFPAQVPCFCFSVSYFKLFKILNGGI